MRVCWAQWVFIGLVAVMGTTQMLTACGNKGPLYLPTEEGMASEEESPTPVNTISTEDALDRLDAEKEQELRNNKSE